MSSRRSWITIAVLAVIAWMMSAGTIRADANLWTEMASGQPLTEGMLVYVPEQDVLVSFGGRDKLVNKGSDPSDALLALDMRNETSEWVDITRAATGIAPGKIFASAGAYWPTREQFVFFAGKGNRDNVVALDLSRGVLAPRWIHPRVPGASVPRSSHSATYISDADRMIVFGGTKGSDRVARDTLDEVLAIVPHGQGFIREPVVTRGATPPKRYNHTAVYDPANRVMLVYGGQLKRSGPTYADLWALDFSEPSSPRWLDLTESVVGPVPGPRSGHTAVYDPLREMMVIVGGKGATAKELWGLDLSGGLSAMSWQKLQTAEEMAAVGTLAEHVTAWVPAYDCMVVYGGTLKGAENPKAWMYHPADSAGHGPPIR